MRLSFLYLLQPFKRNLGKIMEGDNVKPNIRRSSVDFTKYMMRTALPQACKPFLKNTRRESQTRDTFYFIRKT